MAENLYAPVSGSIPLRKEISTFKNLIDSQISYTLVDRTNVYSKLGHYFTSFNIPNEYYAFTSASTVNYAEMFQLNVDKIVIVPISENYYNEFIDGRSITLNVPQWNAGSKKVISSFYNDITKTTKTGISPNASFFGPKNIAFLFSDDVNLPYSGSVNSTTYNNTTWDPTNDFRHRPSAISMVQTKLNPNKDTRSWASVKKAVNVPQSYGYGTVDSLTGYNYDIPVGFVCLDKGCIILTHPEIVDNIPWTSGNTSYMAGYSDISAGENIITGSNAGPSSGTTNIVFTGLSSSVSFTDINIKYLTSTLCIAEPTKFFISNNPTWPKSQNLTEITNNTNNFDSIYVTQIGLYNENQELVAIAKLDRPVEKTYDGIITFNLEIDV